MNFEYAVNRDPDVEHRARVAPALFSPTNYTSINRFLAGTRISFSNDPLDRDVSERMLSLIDAYCWEWNISPTTDSIWSYRGCARARYSFDIRTHNFYLLDALGEVRIKPHLHLGSHVQVDQKLVGFTQFDQFEDEKVHQMSVHCGDMFQNHLKRFFRIKHGTRVNIALKFCSTAVRIIRQTN